MRLYILIAALMLGACSTHKANFSYSEYKTDMPISVEAVRGDEVGAVEGSQGGFVWTQCDEQSRDAVRKMITSAKNKGANAIGQVKWRADGSSVPTCKKSWGFVMLPPILFTPLFASAHVDGIAYKVTGKKAGLMMLPRNNQEEEAFIAQVLELK